MKSVSEIINSKIFLAPMSGVTDMPFRMICRKYGCRFAFTEMIDVNGIYYKNLKTLDMLDTIKNDKPIGVQIVGQDEKKILMAAKACQDKGFPLLDFNAGCPARKVVTPGKGSALMKEPKKLGGILSMLVKELKIPVTLKIRGGWDQDSINCVEIAKIAESAGVSAISIHPRTQSMMYKGQPDHKLSALVKNNVKIPVFASGNVFEKEDIKNILEETGCDGVLVARGSLGRPWIFREYHDEKFQGFTSIDDIKMVILEHFHYAYEYFDERRLFSRMYKHMTWYLKRFKGINEIMKVYTSLGSFDEFKVFLDRIQVNEKRRMFFEG
jgi:tRNA-dihydrouridine synthase B